MQVFGSAELSYLQSLSAAERTARLRRFFGCTIPCLVVARQAKVPAMAIKLANQAWDRQNRWKGWGPTL